MSKTWRTGEPANQTDMLGTPELSLSRMKSWGDSRDGPDLGKIPLSPLNGYDTRQLQRTEIGIQC